ncbi:hypothetical protein FPV67DRAFT_1650397 [Lyophyllum atratum]|nr:hypothetical protein FPV67DRAFT_1650397 [Lyophyllum atratum]
MRFTLKQSSLANTGPQVGFRIDFLGAAALILATVAYQHIPQSQPTLLGRYGSSAIPMPPPPPATSATKPAPSRTAPFGSFQSDSELPHAPYIPLSVVAGGLLVGAATFAAAAVKHTKARKDGQPPSGNDDEAEEDEDVNEQSHDKDEDGDSGHGDPGDPDDPPPPSSGSKVEYDPPHAPLPTQIRYTFLLVVILSALTLAFTYTRFFPAYTTSFRKMLDRAARAFSCNIGPRLNSVGLTTGLKDIPLKLSGSIQYASTQLFNVTTEFVLELVLATIASPAVALAWRTFDVCQPQPWWTLGSDQPSNVAEAASAPAMTQTRVALPAVLSHCWTLAGGLLVSALVGAWVTRQRRGCPGRPVIMTPVEPGDEAIMEDNVALEEEDLQSFKLPAILPIPDVQHSEPPALDVVTTPGASPLPGNDVGRLHDPLEVPLPEDDEADWDEVAMLSPPRDDGEDWHHALSIPLPDDTDDGWVEEVPGRTGVAEASSSTPSVSSISNSLATPVDTITASDVRPELKGLESSRWAPAFTSNPTAASQASTSNVSDGSRKLKHQQRRAQQRQNKKNKHLVPLLADLALDTPTEMAPQDGPSVVSHTGKEEEDGDNAPMFLSTGLGAGDVIILDVVEEAVPMCALMTGVEKALPRPSTSRPILQLSAAVNTTIPSPSPALTAPQSAANFVEQQKPPRPAPLSTGPNPSDMDVSDEPWKTKNRNRRARQRVNKRNRWLVPLLGDIPLDTGPRGGK